MERPWSQLLLHILKIPSYTETPHSDENLARRAGLTVEQAKEGLQTLADSSAIHFHEGRWTVDSGWASWWRGGGESFKR